MLEDRPTVLVLGRGEAMLDAVALALDRHGVQLEVGDSDNPVQSVFVHAPDMVLLVGDASVEEGRVTLEKLAGTVATAVIPVAILVDDAGLDHRMQAARFGAVAVVLRSASADAMAKLIADVARELPERKSEGPTDLGEASLDEVVELFARRLRSGILAVSANGGSERVVLRGDRPVTQAIEELVDRLRPLVTQSETVRWEFQQAPTGKLAELTLDDEHVEGEIDVAALFKQRRVVIVEKSPARADDLVVALRERGAHVVVIDGEGTGLAKARAIDPDVILVDVSGVGGWASQAMQLIRGDSRLRWAALLVTRGEELWRANTPEPDIARLAAGMLPLVEPDESLMQRVRDGKTAIDVRLETTGPTRLLRAVARAGATVHATVRHRRATIEIDFAEGLIVGARGEVAAEQPGRPPSKVEGAAALAVWLGISSGRVRIERREAPSVANVMSPVDDAIAAADRETPLLMPSIPPPAGPPSISPPTPAGGTARPSPSGETDARALVNQLETLLDRLRHTLPPGSLEVPSETAAALAAAGAAVGAGAGPSPPRRDPTGPVAVPPPGRLPGPPGKPPRRATQVGMPVPPIARPMPPAAAPATRAVPPPASDASGDAPAAATHAHPPPHVPPPPHAAPPPAHPAAVVAMPMSVVASSSTAKPIDEDAPTGKRPALSEEGPPSGERPGLAALLEPDPSMLKPLDSLGLPPAAPARTPDLATEPGIALPPAAPLETTDHIALPPERAEHDDVVAIPGARSRGGTWLLIGAAAVIAVLCLGAAAAWRFGLFSSGGPVVTPLPPTTVVLASTVPPPPTTAVIAAPPTSVAPPPTTAIVAPPTSVVAPPPTTVAEVVAPPPTTTVEIAPPPPTTTVEVTPPPPTTTVAEEEADEEEDGAGAREPTGPPREDSQWLVDRANFRRSHGDLPGAEADYLRVLRMTPNNARAMAGLARLHLARHDARTAATWARRLAEGHSPNAGNYVLLGDTLQASGDSAGARRAWEHALEITPNYRDARRRLGR